MKSKTERAKAKGHGDVKKDKGGGGRIVGKEKEYKKNPGSSEISTGIQFFSATPATLQQNSLLSQLLKSCAEKQFWVFRV